MIDIRSRLWGLVFHRGEKKVNGLLWDKVNRGTYNIMPSNAARDLIVAQVQEETERHITVYRSIMSHDGSDHSGVFFGIPYQGYAPGAGRGGIE